VLGPHIFPPGADGEDPRKCPTCGAGRLSLKLGRFGSFVGCSNYPECRYTRQLGQTAEEAGNNGPRVLGTDPETGEDVTVRSGRFGPYIQRGEGEKPQRASIPKGTDAASMDFEYALRLLSLPREVGKHPESGKAITANFGRYGPYVAHDGQYASLETPEDVFTVGINHAVSLLAEKKAKSRSPRGPEALKELGAAPGGETIKLMRGRYGPYVTDGATNATIPRETDPLTLTLDQAVQLIAERVAKGGGKPAKKAAKKKAAPTKKQSAPASKAASSKKKGTGADAKKTAKPKRKTAPAKSG
jgi:DNA topoisomerase-1